MNRKLVLDMNDSISYYPLATERIEALDKTFLGFISEEQVVSVKIPSLISKELLEKCGYFTTFPQHLTQLKPYNGRTLNGSERYLTPAACIHIYPMLEKECFTQTCYTTFAQVYRYENGMFKEPGRLWEFSVREMVFVGTPNYVLSSINKVKQKTLIAARKMNENARIVEANDLFFPTRENQLKMRMQRKNKMKEELTLPYKGEKVAVASFNYHQFHFSKLFNFDQNGKIVTGCIGFGLDRWFLCTEQEER